ncbi:MAG: PilZ domain-containing protein [Hyphomicrobium sp.]
MQKRISFGQAKANSAFCPAHGSPVLRPAPEPNSEEALLFERYTSEIYSSALSCAVILSCFNAIRFDRKITLPAELRSHVPVTPMTLTAIAASNFADLMDPETAAALNSFRYYLENGKRHLFENLVPGRFGSSIRFETLKVMHDAFRSAGHFILRVVKDLTCVHSRMGTSAWISQLTAVSAELEAASRGASPYFKDGAFCLPLPSRRMREMRFQLNSEAVLTYRGTTRRVVIRDISQGGIGVEGAATMHPGSSVQVQLPTGRQLEGEVCWQNGTRAGIILSQRLPASDPLMRT